MAKLQEYTKVNTMDPEESQVHVNLTEGKLTASYTMKRILLGIVIGVVLCLAFFAFLCSIILLKKVNEFNKQRLNDAKHEIRFIRRISARIDGEIQQMRTKDKSSPNTRHELRQSFEDIKDHLNVLIFTVGNLSAVVLRMNSSSDAKISRLRWNLNATNNKLLRLQTELTQLNYSVRRDVLPFIVAAVNDLRQELNVLRNSTTTNVSELWKHWNQTNTEVEDIVKLMVQQNKTLHFKMAYQSDFLYSELKTAEKKQSKFLNDTNKIVTELRTELSQTRHSLQENIDNQIVLANKTWHKALEDAIGSLLSSVAKIDIKVDGIKQELQKSINNNINIQREVKDDFSKTKSQFQEKDRKHDLAISGHDSKMESMKERIAKLEAERKLDLQMIGEQKQELQDLQKSMNNDINEQKEMKNDFSKTKSKFQENDREHDSKMESMKERVGTLEAEKKLHSQMIATQKREMQDLKNRVEKMENGVNGLLKTDIRFIFVLLVTTAGLPYMS
jgi:chromosome segregation ATPase